jgi:hypothetical protein
MQAVSGETRANQAPYSLSTQSVVCLVPKRPVVLHRRATRTRDHTHGRKLIKLSTRPTQKATQAMAGHIAPGYEAGQLYGTLLARVSPLTACIKLYRDYACMGELYIFISKTH